jgi:hypothetical protein|tara:strand:- start:130 stop:273 length:144 start_codon:yes stop_codon:yes gene_type:complete
VGYNNSSPKIGVGELKCQKVVVSVILAAEKWNSAKKNYLVMFSVAGL